MNELRDTRNEAIRVVAEMSGNGIRYIEMQIGTSGHFVTLETAAVSMAERALKAEAANIEQKAEIERLKEDNSRLHRRNCWLETGIACAKSDRLGMKAKLDAFNSGGFADADAMAGKYLEEKAIVDRVWAALGISTYEQAGGKAIDEIVASLRASVGEKWIEIKEGCEMPVFVKEDFLWRYSDIVEVYPRGFAKFTQHVKTLRKEWDYEDDLDDGSPVTHWRPYVAPPTLPGEEK